MEEIILKGLIKISLNKWYSGEHWSKRRLIKKNYNHIIRSQYKNVFSKENVYEVDYVFQFESRPLDASNCVAMLKLIEDIIFQDDAYRIVTKISLKSIKGNEDLVKIIVKKGTK